MMRVPTMVMLVSVVQAGFVKTPYLQNLTDSTIVVRWETSIAQDGKVIYGLTTAYEREVAQTDSTIDHELTLTRLVPDTVYHYRSISGTDTSADAAFRTMAGPGTRFRFIVYGDPHGDSATNQRVADRMAAVSPRPAFATSTGDLTGNGRNAAWRLFFNNQRALLCRAPLFPAPGNHDYDSIPNWHRFLVLPGNELSYSFRYGNSSFHFLNAYDSLVPGSSQYNWFLGELKRDSANPDIQHIFILVHTPPYSTNTVYSGNAAIRSHLCPLFERFGVAIVFSGHVHAYEHSRINGVRYLITGGAGATLATNWNQAQPWTVYREAVYQFTLIDILGDTVFSRGVRVNGTEFDTLVLVSPQVAIAEPRPWHNPTGLYDVRWHNGVISFTLSSPRPRQIRLAVYNPAGVKAAGWLVRAKAGTSRMRRSIPDLPAGTYFLRAETADRAACAAKKFFAVW